MAIDNKDKKILNVPHLRFPEFSGEWEKNNLSKFSSKITKKNKSNFINNVLCNSANLGIIPQNDYFDRDIANADNTDSYYIIEQGDFVYNPRKSTAAPYGPVNIYNGEKPGIISPLYLCFSVFNISPSFLFYRFKSSVWHPYVYSHGDTGVRYDRVSIKDDVFFDMPIYTPTQNEQEKIATLLSLIDERIATQNKIIEDLKKLKSAISKHLFARKDLLETTICLSNIATLKNGYAFQSGKYNALGKWKILTITNVSGERYINDEDYNCIINLPNDIQDHQVLKEGDILISLTGNVGRVSLCKDGDYLLNQRVGLLQLAKNVNQEFLYQILSSQRFENSMIACGQGAAQMNIGKGDVESYVLPYSSNVNNILLVAKILHSYDEYIINEQRKLTLLTMQKQYFLAQMFI